MVVTRTERDGHSGASARPHRHGDTFTMLPQSLTGFGSKTRPRSAVSPKTAGVGFTDRASGLAEACNNTTSASLYLTRAESVASRSVPTLASASTKGRSTAIPRLVYRVQTAGRRSQSRNTKQTSTNTTSATHSAKANFNAKPAPMPVLQDAQASKPRYTPAKSVGKSTLSRCSTHRGQPDGVHATVRWQGSRGDNPLGLSLHGGLAAYLLTSRFGGVSAIGVGKRPPPSIGLRRAINASGAVYPHQGRGRLTSTTLFRFGRVGRTTKTTLCRCAGRATARSSGSRSGYSGTCW